MEKEENKTLAAADNTVNKNSIFIDTYSRKSRIQTNLCTALLNLTPTIQNFSFELDESYDYCTGIAIIDISAGTYSTNKNYISISDNNHNIFNPVHIHFWNKGAWDFNRRNLFMPCFFRAKNNLVNIKLEHQGLTGNYNFYVVFRLENRPGIPKLEYNFLQKQFTIANGFTGIRNDDLTFDSAYQMIKGAKFVKLPGVATTDLYSYSYNGNIIMNQIPDILLFTSSFISYTENYFPLRFNCNNKTITITTQVYVNPGADVDAFHNFLIEKPFDRKYL